MSAGSRSSRRKAVGVSHPAQTLSRGNRARSIDDHVPSREPQLARAGRAGGAAADDERVAADHATAQGVSCGRWMASGQTAAAIRAARTRPGTAASSRSRTPPRSRRDRAPRRGRRARRTSRAPVGGGLEPRAPVREGLGVVQPQVLDVEHRHPGRLEHVRRTPRRASACTRPEKCAGESSAFSGPGRFTADEMQQAAAAVALQRAVE